MNEITLVFPKSPFLIEDHVFPPLGILYLSSSLKSQGISVKCLDLALGHSIDEIESDVVGISFTSAQKEEAFSLAKQLKSKGKTVIGGGAHPTHMPEECLQKDFDAIFRGEGDISLGPFLKAISKTKPIKKIVIDATPVPDLNIAPFPDRDALPIQEYRYIINNRPSTVIMTSRGCVHDCAYCARVSRKYRFQNAERTAAEIFDTHSKYGFSAFMIFDDVFTLNKKRLRTLRDILKGSDFIFRCFGRANLLNPDICELLAELNVVEVGIGIESGSDFILANSNKGTTVKENTKAVQNLHRFGIRAKAFLIVGLPGETEETVKMTEEWIENANPDDIDVSVFQPIPGSAIFANPEKYRIKYQYGGDLWYKGTPGNYKSCSSTEELSAERIIELRETMEKKYKKWGQ